MNPTATLIHSARIVTGGSVSEDGWVLFRGDTIAATGTGRPPSFPELAEGITPGPSASSGNGIEVVDAGGRWLTPGFIDMHCHGAGGCAFDDGPDAIRAALAVHRRHGTTRQVLSLVTAPLRDLAARLAVIAETAEHDPLVLGAHLEGPFLEAGHKGAHDPALLRAADPDAVDGLIEAGRGRLCQVTLAPEQPGGMSAVRRFVASGAAVAVGHSDADYAQTRAAFDAGASILTHAFNGMRGIHHREPGPVVAAMHAPHVTLEVINDGIHLHPDVVRLAFAGAPGRIALITDAMAAAGSVDGRYLLGGLPVTVADGVARLADGGSIAGSTLTLDAALRRAVAEVGLPVGVAVQALTETPARALGRDADLGSVAAGYAADVVLLDEDFTVYRVWAAGRRLR